MRAKMTARLRMPSPGLLVALLALIVAMGGTAYAATTTVVNIADPTTPTHVAAVTASGALEVTGSVSGAVAQQIPHSSFFGSTDLLTDQYSTMIAANKATVALTRLDGSDSAGESEPASFYVVEQGGNATTCDGSSGQRPVGRYDVQPGQTLADVIGSPIVLQPLAAGDVWCLQVYATLEGDPGGYTEPTVAYSGYVSSGTLPAGSIPQVSAATARVKQHTVRGG